MVLAKDFKFAELQPDERCDLLGSTQHSLLRDVFLDSVVATYAPDAVPFCNRLLARQVNLDLCYPSCGNICLLRSLQCLDLDDTCFFSHQWTHNHKPLSWEKLFRYCIFLGPAGHRSAPARVIKDIVDAARLGKVTKVSHHIRCCLVRLSYFR